MSSSPETVSPWAWADTLDAVVAAPAHHSVVLENQHVRALDTRIAPGDTVPLHTHRWPSVLYVLSWSDFVRRDEKGTVVLDTRAVPMTPPQVAWSPALPPHTLENVGATDIHIICVELKRAAGLPDAITGTMNDFCAQLGDRRDDLIVAASRRVLRRETW